MGRCSSGALQLFFSLLFVLPEPAWASLHTFKGTIFEEACMGMEIDPKGPKLDDNFVELAKAARSKEDFYKKLKESPRFSKLNSQFVLMQKSASLDKRNATEEYPRVIGFGGQMILASTDHPSPPRRSQEHVVEGIAYASKIERVAGQDLAGQELHFFTIDYSEGSAKLEISKESCIRCHAGRFNWETYNVWPGAINSKRNYSEKDLIVPLVGKEREEAQKEIETAVANGYYEKLSPEELELYLTKQVTVKKELRGIYQYLDFESYEGSNRELNEFTNSITYDQIIKALQKLPSYKNKKYAALASVMDCGNVSDYLPPEENNLLGGIEKLKNLENEIKLQLEKQDAAKERILGIYQENDRISKADHEDIRRMAGLRYLFEKEGFELGRYSPNFFGRSNGISYGFAHVGAGSFGVNQLMCFIAPELIEEAPSLKKFFNDGDVVDSYRNKNEGKDVCAALKALSLKAF